MHDFQKVKSESVLLAISDFCRTWRILKMELFGSVAKGESDINSDIDIMVTFADPVEWSLYDLVQMEAELELLFGKKTDLVTREAVEHSDNWIRRNEILGSAQLIYAA